MPNIHKINTYLRWNLEVVLVIITHFGMAAAGLAPGLASDLTFARRIPGTSVLCSWSVPHHSIWMDRGI